MSSALRQTPSTSIASESHALSLTLADSRADGRSRTVRLSRERVTIDRSVRGVAMRLSIPVEAYQGVSVGIKPAPTGGVFYELRLAHRDQDLSVALAEAQSDGEIWADWREWAHYFGLPTLIERNEGLVEWGDAPAAVAKRRTACAGVAPQRRRKRRHAAFINRRYAGRGVVGPVHRETEIIARD